MKKPVLSALIIFLLIIAMIVTTIKAESGEKIWYQNQVAVLAYHHVHDTDTSSVTISTELLAEQMDYLLDKGYNFISLSAFQSYMDGDFVPDNAVLVTFDDGYESFYDHVYPLFHERQIPVVNFMITENLDGPQGGRIPYMTTEQIGEMLDASDFIDIQCHSHALHRKTGDGEAMLMARLKLASNQDALEDEFEYEERIRQDTRACIDSLQVNGSYTIDTYAYPYGMFDELAKELLAQEGIRFAFTVEEGIATYQTDPMEIPRINGGSPWITPQLLHKQIMRNIRKATISRRHVFIQKEPLRAPLFVNREIT